MSGIIGRKVGMTTIFDDLGNQVVCTVIEAGPCSITQVKTQEADSYEAVQLGFGARKEKRTSKALQGHFGAAGSDLKAHVIEFDKMGEYSLGDIVSVGDVVSVGDTVDIVGTSKGKGFQGVVKRHGFAGVMQQSHGQHNRQRAPGSIGQGSDPSRVFKGVRMGGRTGGNRITVKNLRVVRVYPEKNLLLVRGAVPGARKGVLEIHTVRRG